MSVFSRKVALFAFILVLFPLVRSVAQQPGIPVGWSDGYAYANGIRIHYYHATPAPGKPVMVMVHGVSDIGLSWTTLTEKLQDSYDIYMLDARGHGLSDPFAATDTGNVLVKDVVDFVRTKQLDKPILMGHSMGAATVMRIGAEYPDLAKAIIMLDPGMGGAGPRPPAPPATTAAAATVTSAPAARPSQPAAPDRLSVSMAGTPERLVAQNNYAFDDLVATCRRNTPKWALLDCQYWALSKKQYHGRYSTEARQATPGSMRTSDALAKITVPALILKADASAEVRAANEEAARVMQRGRLVHIDGAGHNLHHDQLARTVEVLKQFLSTF
ncbi:MAG: alpha/beta hydrolase [Gemmatimonadaceae bacterium]